MKRIDNVTLAQCLDEGSQQDIQVIEKASLVWEFEKIKWVGPMTELPKEYQGGMVQVVDGKGGLLIPGLIDCHTHLAFGGWRGDEFSERVMGKSYSDIAKQGGGILSTVKATREADAEELIQRCFGFLDEMLALGITTVECKSGYGLTVEDELKLLYVYKELKNRLPISIISTFLGAHTIPTEMSREEYVQLVINKMIPEVADREIAEFCDVFVDDHAFSKAEAYSIAEAAKEQGLKIKLHVDQLSADKGAELAAACGATSADHLEYISAAGIAALKESGTVAVSLPLASLYTFQKPLNARPLIEAGVPVALATDFNPGSAPSHHLPLAMMLGCTLNRMSPAEVLKATTLYAAKAIDRSEESGSLQLGKQADFALIDSPSVEHWMYHFKANANQMTVKNGMTIYQR